jgi:hypothetical protein
MFNGALADLSLTTNPWTLGRYTFAGGNPTTLVEDDGHMAVREIDGNGGGGGRGVELSGGVELGEGWEDLPYCARGSWIEPGQTSCPSAGYAKEGLEPWLRDIVLAAGEANIDPRLLLTVLIVESGNDRSDDRRNAYWDEFIPDVIREASVGIANMQTDTFIITVENHPDAFGQDPDTGKPMQGGFGANYLWELSADDEVLSIRVAAYHLRDLMDAQPARSGTGAAYTQEQLAAIGYHVGESFMVEIAEGSYPSKHNTSAPMGDAAQDYLTGYDYWRRNATTWICVEGVLVC